MSGDGGRIGVGEWLASSCAVGGLVAVGLAQPLLDLYGRNPELFSAAKLPQRQVIAFPILIALGPPVLWALVALLLLRAPTAFRAWRAVGIGIGALLAAAVILRKLGAGGIVAIPVALVVAAAVAVLVERIRPLRSVATFLGILVPATIALFLFASPQASYTWSDAAGAKPVGKTARTPTVVWLVFDETNLPMLLRDDGTVDAKRYPNIAALAATATWYRNATGVDNFTPRAVPGLLASQDGSHMDRRPVLRDYPTNAFSLLQGDYAIDAVQPVTDMCPRAACPVGAASGRERFRDFLHDASVVYGHLSLPVGMDGSLPPIDDAWGGFNDGGAAGGVDPKDPLAKVRRVARGPSQQYGVLRAFAGRFRQGERPTFHFAHVLIPHRPWRATPDGRIYSNGVDAGFPDLNPPDAWLQAIRARRYALQAGLLDTAIGMLRANLEAKGLWDGAVVIVTADHGINLESGTYVREPPSNGDTLDELYRVPLFIKSPGQKAGTVSDVPASTMDILPTLLGILGAKRPDGLLGVDLAGSVPADRARTVWVRGKGLPFPSSEDGLTRTIGIYDGWFPAAKDGWERILDAGPYGRLVGTAVPAATAAAPKGARWTLLAPVPPRAGKGTSIALFEARVTLPGNARPADGALLVTSRGRIVGALGGARADGDGYRVGGILDWRAVKGDPGFGLLLATGDPSSPRLATVPPA